MSNSGALMPHYSCLIQVFFLVRHVVAPGLLELRQLIVGEGPLHTRRHADHQCPRRHFHPFGHQRSRTDERGLADDRAVEDPRAHPDQRAAMHGAAMNDRAMADGHFLGDDGRPLFVRYVNRAVVLHVRARADADQIDVAADGRAEPDRAVVPDLDVAYQRRVFGDEHPLADARLFPVKRPENHQARESSTRAFQRFSPPAMTRMVTSFPRTPGDAATHRPPVTPKARRSILKAVSNPTTSPPPRRFVTPRSRTGTVMRLVTPLMVRSPVTSATSFVRGTTRTLRKVSLSCFAT